MDVVGNHKTEDDDDNVFDFEHCHYPIVLHCTWPIRGEGSLIAVQSWLGPPSLIVSVCSGCRCFVLCW